MIYNDYWYFRTFWEMEESTICEDDGRSVVGPRYNASKGDFVIDFHLRECTKAEPLRCVTESVPRSWSERPIFDQFGSELMYFVIWGESLIPIRVANQVAGWVHRAIEKSRREHFELIEKNVPGLPMLEALASAIENPRDNDNKIRSMLQKVQSEMAVRYERAALYMDIMEFVKNTSEHGPAKVFAAKKALILLEKGASMDEVEDCRSNWLKEVYY